MPTYHLYLDSRERIAGPPCQPSFVLSNSIVAVKSVEVRSFHFANTLFNVDDHNNMLQTSSGEIQMEPGFYSAADFVSVLDGLLQLRSAVVQTHVTLAQATNRLQWTLPATFTILGGSMVDVLGYYGGTSTQLVLGSPQAIQVQCNELQTHTRNVTARRPAYPRSTLITIDASNNVITYQTGVLIVSYTVPVGQYSYATLAAALSDCPAFTVTYDVLSNRFIFFSVVMLFASSPIATTIGLSANLSPGTGGGACGSPPVSTGQARTSGDGTLNPLLIVPVTVGYGAMENYDPTYRMAHQLSHGILNRLTFSVSDARTGRPLSELTAWSIVISVVVNG